MITLVMMIGSVKTIRLNKECQWQQSSETGTRRISISKNAVVLTYTRLAIVYGTSSLKRQNSK